MLNYHIPDVFYKEDTVYHYTTIETATIHILDKGQLRLSPMRGSKDPLEVESVSSPKKQFNLSSSFARCEVSSKSIDKLTTKIDGLQKNVKQLCFCRNKKNQYRKKRCIDDLGFLKPRMWDQYGGHFEGVCLAFSLNKLRTNNQHVSWKKRDYHSFESMSTNANIEIDFHRFLQMNKLDMKNEYRDILFNHTNKKHIDFEGENEIRAISMSDNEYEYISLGNSLVGIIISCVGSGPDQYWLSQLGEYSQKFNAEIINLLWRDHEVLIETNFDRELSTEMVEEWKRIFFD